MLRTFVTQVQLYFFQQKQEYDTIFAGTLTGSMWVGVGGFS